MKGSYIVQVAIGAFIYYLASGFGNNYSYFHSKEFERKNFWTGYFASILAFVLFIFILYIILK